MNIIGDVKGRCCILIDDIVDSGGTLCNAAQALIDAGATSVAAYITHGVLSGGAVARVNNSALTELVITDSHPADRCRARDSQRIRILRVAPLIGEAVRRIADEKQRQLAVRLRRMNLTSKSRFAHRLADAARAAIRPHFRQPLAAERKGDATPGDGRRPRGRGSDAPHADRRSAAGRGPRRGVRRQRGPLRAANGCSIRSTARPRSSPGGRRSAR